MEQVGQGRHSISAALVQLNNILAHQIKICMSYTYTDNPYLTQILQKIV